MSQELLDEHFGAASGAWREALLASLAAAREPRMVLLLPAGGEAGDLRLLHANPTARDLVPEGSTGKRFLDLFPGLEGSALVRSALAVARGGSAVQLDTPGSRAGRGPPWSGLELVPYPWGCLELRISRPRPGPGRTPPRPGFLARLSHDLRAPLNTILGFSKLLLSPRAGLDEGSHRDQLRHIEEAAGDLLQLVDDVLQLARIETGVIEFLPRPLELSRLVGERIAAHREELDRRRIEVEVRVSPEVERLVLDPPRLAQVLDGFLAHALRAVPEEGRIEVRAEPAGGERVRLAVLDDGAGLAPEERASLWDGFERVDPEAPGKLEGTGLGLSLARRLVEAQGGEVGVRSTPDEGSELWALLPRDRGPPAPERKELLEELPAPDAAAPILVVEDDPEQRRWAREILEAGGHRVEEARSGRDAVRLGQQRRYSAVILDLLLPDLDGWDVARALRAGGPNRTTPLMVASVAPESRLADAVRIDEFFPKPVDPDELLLALRRHGLEGTTRPVLVIEEDEGDRERACGVLSRAGYAPVPCASPDEAMDEFQRVDPEALVLGLVVGDMGAPELLAHLRDLDGDEHRPAIVHTHRDLTPAERESLLDWASAVIVPRDEGAPGRRLLEALERVAPVGRAGAET